MKEKYIGIFDSGIGGLTVVKSIIEMMPNENIIYFGDTLNMPYGNKSDEEIINFVLSNGAFLSSFDLKAMLIACNTADSVGRNELKNHYDLPIFGVVQPASLKAVQTTINKKVGVIATAATVNSKAYESAISKLDSSVEVYCSACPELASLVEEGKFTKDDLYTVEKLNEYLKPLIDMDVDTLILGCTHYPLLTEIIQDIMPDVNIISSSDCAARKLHDYLEENELLNDKLLKREYYVSSDPERFIRVADIFMGKLDGEVKLKEL